MEDLSVRVKSLILMLACGLTLSCSSSSSPTSPATSTEATPSTTPPPAPVTPAANVEPGASGQKIDSCAVLTSDELKSVLGESLKETKASDRADGGFKVSQCFYSLPTFNKSVSVSITMAGTRDPKEFWRETFHRDEEERDRERKREEAKGEKDRKASKDRREEEEEESAPPEKIAGVGDEAFWMSSPIGGALYVLKKNVLFRISIGGADDQKTRLNKCKALAGKILARI